MNLETYYCTNEQERFILSGENSLGIRKILYLPSVHIVYIYCQLQSELINF